MKNVLFGIGVTTVAVALAATLVMAEAGGGANGRDESDQRVGQQARGGRGGPTGRFGFGVAGLNLTEEQREKVSTIQRAAREQAAPAEAELRAAQRDLHRELFADGRDAAKIADLSANVAALQQQLADLHVTTTSSLSDLLTDEQRAIVRARDGHGGPGRGGPGRGFGRFGQPPNRR
jgi:Spy/CpxP family protein refolding chaperone